MSLLFLTTLCVRIPNSQDEFNTAPSAQLQSPPPPGYSGADLSTFNFTARGDGELDALDAKLHRLMDEARPWAEQMEAELRDGGDGDVPKGTLVIDAIGVSVLVGTLEPGKLDGRLSFPQSVCQLDATTLLLADRSNARVCSYDLSTRELSTWAGVGEFDADGGDVVDDAKPRARQHAQLIAPSAVCCDPLSPHAVFIATDDLQKVLRRVDKAGTATIVAGAVHGGEPAPDDKAGMAAWALKVIEPRCAVGLGAVFSDIACILPATLKGSTEALVYLACMSSHCVRSYNPRTGEVRLVVGDGDRGSHTRGRLADPFGLAVDSLGRLIISCLEDCTILRFDPTIEDATQRLELLAGSPGKRWFNDGMGATEALLGNVAGLTVDPFDTIYFADHSHGAIRAISPDGYVYTLVSSDETYTELSFLFATPFGIAFDHAAWQAGQPRLFVVDLHRLIQIDLDPASFPTLDAPLTTGRRIWPNARTLPSSRGAASQPHSARIATPPSTDDCQKAPKQLLAASSSQASAAPLAARSADAAAPSELERLLTALRVHIDARVDQVVARFDARLDALDKRVTDVATSLERRFDALGAVQASKGSV